jgi:CelD/BcsL family acetyltransferase involved in cellulose biosynthesis
MDSAALEVGLEVGETQPGLVARVIPPALSADGGSRCLFHSAFTRVSRMLEVSTIRSLEGFAALKGDWDECLDRCPDASVFVTWDWLYRWWVHYGVNHSLRLVVARQQGRVVGLLPLYVRRERVLAGIPVRVLRPVGAGADTEPDYLGAVVDDAHGAEALAALCRSVVADPSWDVMELTDFTEDSAFPAAMEAACREAGLPVRRLPWGRLPIARLPGTWNEYLATMTKDQRHNIRRARRRAIEECGGRLFNWEDAATLDVAIDRLGELHRQRRKDLGTYHSFSTSEYVAFHRDVMHACHARGRLRLHCLELQGEIVAVNYCYVFRDEMALFQCGFDPNLERLRPGYVLVAWSIEQAITEGMRVFDFLRGDHAYKRIWARDCRSVGLLNAHRRTPRALLFDLRRYTLPSLRRRLQTAPPTAPAPEPSERE